MRATKLVAVVFALGVVGLLGTTIHAQTNIQRIALKNGESVELQVVYWVVNCRSTMVGLPEIEVLEGPPEVTLAIKEGMVLPRRFNCANSVPGGTVVATAKEIKETTEAKLTYRLKYKTKGRRASNRPRLLHFAFPMMATRYVRLAFG